MHPRVERFPKPDPDYRRFLAAVHRQGPDRIPLVELAVDAEVVTALLDQPMPHDADAQAEQKLLGERNVRLLHRLGYDVVKVSAAIPFGLTWIAAKDTAELGRGERTWQDEHGGLIHSLEECEAFDWPKREDLDFGPVEAVLAAIPEGMAAVGFSGGVFEFATYLIGLEPLMYAVYDQPELVAAVFERVGQTIYAVFEAYCEIDSICALWLGDDLGSKNGLMISPAVLAEHVFPWFKRYVELAHKHGRPFLLHSCGNIAAAMPALVDEVGIDAKHSFEDLIQPVEQFIDAWGSKIGVMGGLDVGLLASGTEEAVAQRTLEVLEHAAPGGGYACGSGNSIPNYVSPDNYLAMIEAATRFNGRM